MKKPMILYIFRLHSNWSCERSMATLFPETSSFGQMSQYRHLLASSPPAFLNQHQSNSPAQHGFPAPGAGSSQHHSPKHHSQKVSWLPKAEGGRRSALQEANANVCLWNFSVRFVAAVSTQSFWNLTSLLSYRTRRQTAGPWFQNVVTKWLSVKVSSILWLSRQSDVGFSALTYSVSFLLTQCQYSNPHIPVRG